MHLSIKNLSIQIPFPLQSPISTWTVIRWKIDNWLLTTQWQYTLLQENVIRLSFYQFTFKQRQLDINISIWIWSDMNTLKNIFISARTQFPYFIIFYSFLLCNLTNVVWLQLTRRVSKSWIYNSSLDFSIFYSIQYM